MEKKKERNKLASRIARSGCSHVCHKMKTAPCCGESKHKPVLCPFVCLISTLLKHFFFKKKSIQRQELKRMNSYTQYKMSRPVFQHENNSNKQTTRIQLVQLFSHTAQACGEVEMNILHNRKLLHLCSNGGGGGSFFLACEDFGECSTTHFPHTLFFFFLKWRLARAH